MPFQYTQPSSAQAWPKFGSSATACRREQGHFRRKFAVVEPVRLQVEVVGGGHGRGAGSLGQARAGDQPQLKRGGDLFDDLVLERENLAPGALEALRPEMAAVGGVDQLGVDAQVVAGATDAAFEDVADAQFLADLRRLDGLALVGEGGVAGNDEQAGMRKLVVMSSVMPSAR